MLSLSALLCALPVLATAETGQALPLSYEVFEASVPHLDLKECPGDLAQGDVFCRATLAHDEIHVFVFAIDGDSPMVGYASYDAAELPKLLN
jgi:hypothetical protein